MSASICPLGLKLWKVLSVKVVSVAIAMAHWINTRGLYFLICSLHFHRAVRWCPYCTACYYPSVQYSGLQCTDWETRAWNASLNIRLGFTTVIVNVWFLNMGWLQGTSWCNALYPEGEGCSIVNDCTKWKAHCMIVIFTDSWAKTSYIRHGSGMNQVGNKTIVVMQETLTL